MRRDVFISHASEDRDVADAACAALEQRGLSCWIAPRDLPPAVDAGPAALAALGDASLCVFIQSDAAGTTPQLRRELGEAGRRAVPVAVLQVDDALPPAALQGALIGARRIRALTPPLAPHLDYLGDLVAELLAGGPGTGRQLTQPPQPLPRRPGPRHNWLTIALAGLVGLAAVALAAFYAGPRAP